MIKKTFFSVDEDGHQLTSRDLDECHGKWHGSEYRYHVTADYPYFLRFVLKLIFESYLM